MRAVATARLPELTVRDEHRLRRRAERLRGDDAQGRAALDAEIARAEERIARRRASVPRDHLPAGAAGQRGARTTARGDPRPPGRRRRRRDRLGQDDAAAEDLPRAGARRARRDRPHAAAPDRGAHGRRADRATSWASQLGERGRLRGALQRPLARGHARAADDRRPAARRDRSRDRLLRRYDTIIVDEAHERSLNIDFLLGYLKRDPAAAARPEADHHVGDDRPARGSARTSAARRSSRSRAARTRSRCATGRVEDAEDPDRDQTDAIGDAVDELLREPAGDVLVFLQRRARDPRHRRGAARAAARPTSRSCRSTRGCRRAEQQRVFKPHDEPPRSCSRRTSPRRR